MMMEALKIAGIEKMPIYQAMKRILDDKRVKIHFKPLCTRYSFKKDGSWFAFYINFA